MMTVETTSGRLLERVQAEFNEMPGLILSIPQAARLWGVTTPEAKALLAELTRGGFLARNPRGLYRRRGACPRCS
jgi:DNA-binding IclR family transcriptional regulator